MTYTIYTVMFLLAIIAVIPWLFLLLGVAEVRLKWPRKINVQHPVKSAPLPIVLSEPPPIYTPDYYAGFDDCVGQVESQGYTVEVQHGT